MTITLARAALPELIDRVDAGVVVPFALGVGAALALGQPGTTVIFLGAALAFTLAFAELAQVARLAPRSGSGRWRRPDVGSGLEAGLVGCSL